ncbi:heme biosynthesis protein HemY [Nitratireductor aestuarii]|uniref:Heme biosynthesis protein HemY n=1 Tax=Nitratireductor aestuarii TaxID=1735103 RepID=A0A916W2S4_9HYPH|nr:heme biosynthesis HemY N-terminal domain-containing protein [Nitratireductor aestuarii]GGA61439.1 heme biosynthesis protein HemY [Nitratireductor aestuarii]
MIRTLFFLAIVLALGLGFMWLAERPGDLVVTFGGYQYQVTLLAAAVILVAAFAAMMISWWIIRGVWRSPYAVTRYFRVRRRDRGYQALSTGLIAAGAGDGGTARRMGKQAAKLISSDQEPLIHLLDAQAALLEGDHTAARAKFEAMAKDPETRLLGLRGLYLEAERIGDRNAARQIASEAANVSPQLGWASAAALEMKTVARDWDGAISLVDARSRAPNADRAVTSRQRAVLLTAKALEELDSHPSAAKTLAQEAHRLQPDFVPAAVTLARADIRLNDQRKASKVLEAIWKRSPHPDVADVYIHLRHGDSTFDRLERARRLRKLRSNNVESELAVARAALDAGEFAEARAAAEAAVRLEPREGAFLLLADIEEAETGDQGRIRHWLAQAVRAPQDPAWVADGVVLEKWAPTSPVTGQLDGVQWRPPMERFGQVIEVENALKSVPALPAAPVEPETLKVDEPLTKALSEAPAPQQPVQPEPARAAEPAPAEEEKRPAFVEDLVEDEEATRPFQPPIPDDPGPDADDDEAENVPARAGSGLRLF